MFEKYFLQICELGWAINSDAQISKNGVSVNLLETEWKFQARLVKNLKIRSSENFKQSWLKI